MAAEIRIRPLPHLMTVLTALICALSFATSVEAQSGSLAVRDSFRIGSTGVLCSAQTAALDPDAPGMFDRAYTIVCRDASAAVGRLYALRVDADDSLAALRLRREATLECATPTPIVLADLEDVQVSECARRSDGLPYQLYAVQRRNTVYVAEGLKGYESAVTLGLRTLATDRPVEGAVEVAVTQAGDPAAFARTQAGMVDADTAMNEGYLRNNAGSFAEAAAFFGSLVEGGADRPRDAASAEYLLNNGLQQSNLGDGPAADLAFRQAEERGAAGDPVLGRMLRNYRAMAALNRRRPREALTQLAAPVVQVTAQTDEQLSRGVISETVADRINRANLGTRRLSGVQGRLRPYERARILDAQAATLRGTALRLSGRPAEALSAFAEADGILSSVRGGDIASAAFLKSEALAETALTREALGDLPGADRDFTESVQLLTVSYPLSASGLMAKARLAAYRARRGDTDNALALYGEVVDASHEIPGGATALRDLLRPYFALLARHGDDRASVVRMFAASQVLTRPGLAQTQAVLARELSAGDDEAARLFRETLTRSREVTRAAGDVATLAAEEPADGTAQAQALITARARLAALQEEQVTLQARLAVYPRYRVLDPQGLSLAELQGALRPGEAYYEVRTLGPDAYAIFITPDDARAFRIDATTTQIGTMVADLRNSIVRLNGGQFVTRPFDVDLSQRLYEHLFGPLGEAMGKVSHLIYEPDGPLLQLPPNLLVMDQASVDRYAARTASRNGDPFDFTGVAWLGRDRDVTTAVSPRAFVDVRAAPPSRAERAYIGLGSNARPNLMTSFLSPRPTAMATDRCAWPLDTWMNPIRPDELYAAREVLGAEQGAVAIHADFSDSAIARREDLADYRIVHFATHGLVTAPHPDCAARPALLTSFGSGGSDGLLSFREIYDLRIDADVVILSACDTAGTATIEATRDAGVATGGNFALDGLVRAFVGAGGRTIVASHWPVPDDYDATRTLILGMIEAPPGAGVATALRQAERGLMDQAATSHPYYWAAFAVVGDGERPIAVAR